jgi:FkbM family methyltransferase
MPLGNYETETATWLQNTIEHGSTFVDIGANAGYFVLLGSKLVGRDGEVWAFEPSPEFNEMIHENVTANDLSNVRIQRVALSNEVGTAEFVIETTGANSHFASTKIGHAESRPTDVIEVETETLDNLVQRGELIPDVVKIDVEGAEVQVLEGMVKTMRGCGPSVIVSCHSDVLEHQCRAVFERCDYRVNNLSGFEHELIGHPSS